MIKRVMIVLFHLIILSGFLVLAVTGECDNFDFEQGTKNGWTRTGTAFESQPTYGDNAAERPGGERANFQGDWWIGTYENRSKPELPGGNHQGDEPKGTLTSPKFRIAGPKIGFLVGGTCVPSEARVELLVSGHVTRTASAKHCSDTMEEQFFDVKNLIGKTAQIRLVDASRFGHLSFDDLKGDFYCSGILNPSVERPHLYAKALHGLPRPVVKSREQLLPVHQKLAWTTLGIISKASPKINESSKFLSGDRGGNSEMFGKQRKLHFINIHSGTGVNGTLIGSGEISTNSNKERTRNVTAPAASVSSPSLASQMKSSRTENFPSKPATTPTESVFSITSSSPTTPSRNENTVSLSDLTLPPEISETAEISIGPTAAPTRSALPSSASSSPLSGDDVKLHKPGGANQLHQSDTSTSGSDTDLRKLKCKNFLAEIDTGLNWDNDFLFPATDLYQRTKSTLDFKVLQTYDDDKDFTGEHFEKFSSSRMPDGSGVKAYMVLKFRTEGQFLTRLLAAFGKENVVAAGCYASAPTPFPCAPFCPQHCAPSCNTLCCTARVAIPLPYGYEQTSHQVGGSAQSQGYQQPSSFNGRYPPLSHLRQSFASIPWRRSRFPRLPIQCAERCSDRCAPHCLPKCCAIFAGNRKSSA